ncbi:MAG TPA: anthranilate synthase component I family protein [Pyrinomonadaceae bacterium]|nr:anthranilate synthase component I family protein [Pyrinomonadaceae bacterium]
MDLQPSSFADFERAAQRGNVVPVVRTVPAQSRTPTSALSRITGAAAYSFLLESVEGTQQFAQYSFLGAKPEMVVRGRGNLTVVQRGEEQETISVGLPDFLRDYFSTRKLARRPGLPPFAGGMVGYLAYSAAHWFEPSLSNVEDQSTDDGLLMFYRTVLAFDRINHQILITCLVFTEEAAGSNERLQTLYDDAVVETARIEVLLKDATAQAPGVFELKDPNGTGAAFSSNWSRDGFQDAVLSVKEYIAAGDCYQAVLSQRFTKQVAAAPASIYEALRVINPSPYMYFLRMGDKKVIGASPEMLVRCRGPRLDYRPIAGTRRRGANKAEDWLLASEMRRDEKEVAEHMMLVDLGRNDLGRVADYGSVQVDDLMNVESYSHVLHLVSSLRARLRNGLDRFDALASCFPAGTVTGAPKLRAMQIISDLEPSPRGIYAGTVLHADYGDNLDSCIAIRTIVLEGNTASVQAGAGIVADSVPEREYEETINKAKGLMRAIEIAEKEFRRQ